MSELQKINIRLNQLEKTNNYLKIALIFVILLFLPLLITGFSKSSSEITTNKLTFLYEGNPCFSLKAGESYHPGDSLILSDNSGLDRMKILLNSTETKLSLFDGKHDIAGLDLFSNQKSSGLFISNRDWNIGKFWVNDGEPTIELFSEKGRPHFKIPR
jgi:hypothetical protein